MKIRVVYFTAVVDSAASAAVRDWARKVVKEMDADERLREQAEQAWSCFCGTAQSVLSNSDDMTAARRIVTELDQPYRYSYRNGLSFEGKRYEADIDLIMGEVRFKEV